MKEILLDNDLVAIELEDGIVITYLKVKSVDLNIAKQAVKYRLDHTHQNPYYLISNVKGVKSITKEGRDFFASADGAQRIICCAMVIGSNIGAMIGNFFILISKPIVPVKLFSDMEEAKKWLLQIKNKTDIQK